MPFQLGLVVVACLVAVDAGRANSAETQAPSAAKPATDEAGHEFFERKIRPLLAQHCYSCHGRGQTKGGLGLDSREAMLAGGDSGTVVVLGKPDESLLLEVVTYDGDVQMPPSGKLTGDEIAALREWLAMGAPWPAAKPGPEGDAIRTDGRLTDADRRFWSFQPIGKPEPPPTKNTAWPRGPLDQFVLARLEAEQLAPTAEADRRTLVRRATFDLLGLPPTPDEVAAFVADDRKDAYERLIDRLLASPHFGERWARHWLDVARYGEDQAHTFAARLYPSGYRYRDWVVNAFNRDLPFDQFVIEQIAGDLLPDDGRRLERLPALGLFALGPVYYGDAGCSQRARADEYDDRIDTLCRGLLGLTVACARCHDHKFDPISMHDYYALAGVFASSQYVEAPLAPADVVRVYDEKANRVKDAEQRLKDAQQAAARALGESLAGRTADYLTATWNYERRRASDAKHDIDAAARGAGLEVLVLRRWQAHLEADRVGKHALFAAWRALPESANPADVRREAEAIQAKITAAVDLRRQVADAAKMPVPPGKSTDKPAPKPTLDKASADLLKYVLEDRSAPLAIPKEQIDKLLPADRKRQLADLQKEIDGHKKALGEKYPIAHSLGDGPVIDMPIHLRGNHKDLGEVVPRRFLSVVSPEKAPPFKQGSGRLELARAIAGADNPLTARVFVNRVWQQLFGRGIVGTPSNFGLLGERPTHPELLDHLASRFIASRWSTKQLLREIMLSTTYRQASTFRADAFERDPDNRLLWRMNRRRLDVEAWRDALLSISGTLDLKLGGPSLNLKDANNRRRTLYAAVSRHDLNPMLRLFDFPDPNLTSERRVMTTVPMQQLFVLNGDFMIGQARALAASLGTAQAADEGARVEAAYRRIFGRAPTADERNWGVEFVTTIASPPNDAKLSPWEQYVHALLSTNEFTFID